MDADSIRQVRPEKLDALTSLRFFAAALIVVHHSFEHFGFGVLVNRYFPTYQAVSFFFVLSGFILTYVYRGFDSPGAFRRFLIARVARVWPLHAFTLLMTLVIFQGWLRYRATGPDAGMVFWWPLVSNFFLMQCWVPVQDFFWSFNSVSWSISTEFGFYLLFPILLYLLNRHLACNWAVTLGLTLGIAAVMHVASTRWVTMDTMTVFGVVCINPLARIFEFTSGMVMALFFSRLGQSYRPGKAVATGVEIAALIAVLAGMSLNFSIQSVVASYLGWAGRIWVDVGNVNAITVAPFILIMALARGGVSRGLSRKGFVLLGEISFSVYLVHQILLRIYSNYFKSLDVLPLWISYGYFWIALLVGSYLLWEIVEKPCRKAIINLGKGYGFRGMDLELLTVAKKKSVWAAVLISCILLGPLYLAGQATPRIAVIDQNRAEMLCSYSIDGFRDIRFGSGVLLKGVIFDESSQDSMKLIWQSLRTERLKYRVAVHFLDLDGKILSQADYDQSRGRKGKVRGNTFWIDDIKMSGIPKTFHTIGLALYLESDMTLLPVSAGLRDWNNTRLIIPMSH